MHQPKRRDCARIADLLNSKEVKKCGLHVQSWISRVEGRPLCTKTQTSTTDNTGDTDLNGLKESFNVSVIGELRPYRAKKAATRKRVAAVDHFCFLSLLLRPDVTGWA
jgi:hypothetical protein